MQPGMIVVVLVIILGSMILHELAHGLVAYALGDTTAKDEGRLSLNPLRHLDPITSVLIPLLMFFTGGPIFGGAKPVPINTSRLKGGAWGMALVGIAGPLTNFLLALITFLIGHFTGVFYGTESTGSILMYVVSINLGFFVFNMIPIPPLDGSRVLYAIAPDGARDFMEKVERGLGIWLVFGLILIFSSALSSLMANAINGILHFFLMLVGAA